MLKAQDVMTKSPKFFTLDTPIADVAQNFVQNTMITAPILDAAGNLVGVLNEVNLIKALISHHAFMGAFAKIGDHKDILEKPVIVRTIDGLDIVVKSIIQSSNHRVVVLDENRKLAGLIS